MPANPMLQAVTTRGWRLGFANLLAKENKEWWGTRRWWIQAIIWMAGLNGFVAFVLFVLPVMLTAQGEEANPVQMGTQIFFTVGMVAISIGVIILTQDQVIGEKQSGTAEWVLSKPVSRTAFILAKLVANVIGVFVILIVLQSTVAYALVSLARGSLFSPSNFLAGMGLIMLHVLFYLTLTLMMGVLVNNRGMVLGISLGSLLGGSMVRGVVGPLGLVTPWTLPDIASIIVSGEPIPSMLIMPIGSTAIWCAVFMAMAIWKFEHSEL